MRPSSGTNGLKQAVQFGLDNKLRLADAQQEIAIETRCIGWTTRSSRPNFEASDRGAVVKAGAQAAIESL
jgi:hypothetical protein